MNDEQDKKSPEEGKTEETKSRTKLDLLPDAIKKELDSLIMQGWGPRNIKKALEDRHKVKTEFLPASESTYYAYMESHKDDIMKAKEIQQSLIEETKGSLADTKGMVDATTENVSIDNKKQALEALFNRCEKRIKMLTSLQQSGYNYFGTEVEKVIGSYIREQRQIVEKCVALQTQLNKDSTDQSYKEFENLTYLWGVTALNCYKEVQGDNKFLEFKSKLKIAIRKTIQSYLANKNKG